MAVSIIEEKILGRLAKLVEISNPFLSASLYQVLGLSILLSRKLYRARKLRKLDGTRDTKSLQLYHHIIWLAREGLSTTEVYILPNCEDGEHGRELKVMAAKLRASLYHVFCLFHNHPPISHISSRSHRSSDSPPSSGKSAKEARSARQRTTEGSPKNGKDSSDGRRRPKANLRDAIPSMVSEASYITNPYASGQSPPPGLSPLDAQRTPTRPPGLAPIDISPTHAAASYLLPPLNFVPMAREHFQAAQSLADRLLPSTHALRLSITLEHAAFLWDCAKEHERARTLSRRAIKEVYSSSDGLDDDEFADASALVQALGAMVKRGSNESTPVRYEKPLDSAPSSSAARVSRKAVPRTVPPLPAIPQPLAPKMRQPPTIDRTIPVSPPSSKRNGPRTTTVSPQQVSKHPSSRTLDRLSTVHEVGESTDDGARSVHHPTFSPPPSQQGTISPPTSRQPTASPPKSRPNSRASRREREKERKSSTASASDKATKRKIVEQAEQDLERRRSQSTTHSGGGHTSRSPEQSRHSSKRGGTDHDARQGRSSRNDSGSGSSSSRRDGYKDGKGASGGDSQPHSRQATPSEGLDSFPLPPSAPPSRSLLSTVTKESKRARKKTSRKRSAAGSMTSRDGSESAGRESRRGLGAISPKKTISPPHPSIEEFLTPPQHPTPSAATTPTGTTSSPPTTIVHAPSPPPALPTLPPASPPCQTPTRSPLPHHSPPNQSTAFRPSTEGRSVPIPPPPPPTRAAPPASTLPAHISPRAPAPTRHASSSSPSSSSSSSSTDRRDAILRTLQILSVKVSRTLAAGGPHARNPHTTTLWSQQQQRPRTRIGTRAGTSGDTNGEEGGVYQSSLNISAMSAARLEVQAQARRRSAGGGGAWRGG